MPHARFRLRTMMIVVASLAVLMGLFTALLRLSARTNAPMVFAFVFVAIAVLVVAVVVQDCVVAVYFWRGRARSGEFLMTDNRPFRRREPERSGESEGV
jgi:uncharacterized membrane protein